jgi:hypothetical protein
MCIKITFTYQTEQIHEYYLQQRPTANATLFKREPHGYLPAVNEIRQNKYTEQSNKFILIPHETHWTLTMKTATLMDCCERLCWEQCHLHRCWCKENSQECIINLLEHHRCFSRRSNNHLEVMAPTFYLSVTLW